MDFSVITSKIGQFFRWFERYPGACIVLGIVLMIIAFIQMRERQSSEGMFTIVIIAVFLFIYGLGGITGLGFGMSF